MLEKIYLEITNVCNLNCSFCHKTSREKKLMNEDEFNTLTDKLSGKTKYLYFHLMGEPTLHPLLPRFIRISKEKGFIPMLTTNGSLLGKVGKDLLQELPYKISISMHAPEANPTFADPNYFDSCISFAKSAEHKGCIVALRLWNLGTDTDNSEILNRLHSAFPGEWEPIRGGTSLRLYGKIFLEWGEHFEWPDDAIPEDSEKNRFCYALRDHIGVHVDGTVVPCCLDSDGKLQLGNLFDDEFDNIINCDRARSIKEGFSRRIAVEAFCRKCGFAKKFNK